MLTGEWVKGGNDGASEVHQEEMVHDNCSDDWRKFVTRFVN